MECARQQVSFWEALDSLLQELDARALGVHQDGEVTPRPGLQMGDRVAPESRPGDRGAGRCPRCNERHLVGQRECRDFRKGES